MDKLQCCNRYHELYSQLTDTKRNSVSRLINKLLNDNFIYKAIDKDANDYYSVNEFSEIIENYLEMMDFELVHDFDNRIFFVRTKAERNRVRLKKLETIMILLLRKLYDKNLKNVTSSTFISTTIKEINESINETGIYNEMPTLNQIVQALRTLKRYKIVNFIKLEDEDSVIIIYPTLLHIVTINDINMLEDKINSYKLTKEEEQYEVSED